VQWDSEATWCSELWIGLWIVTVGAIRS